MSIMIIEEEPDKSLQEKNVCDNFTSFRSRHQKYLNKKYNKDNDFSLDGIVPCFLLFLSSFILFLETFMNAFLSIVDGTSFSKKVCNSILRWGMTLEEIRFSLFSQFNNTINENNQKLLYDKIEESGNKFYNIITRFEDFFYNENKDIIENTLHDIDKGESKQ